MITELIFDKLDVLIHRLDDGEKVAKGEISAIFDLANTVLFEQMEQQKKEETPVDEELISMADKITLAIYAVFAHWGQVIDEDTQKLVPNPVPYCPVAPWMVPDPVCGWRLTDAPNNGGSYTNTTGTPNQFFSHTISEGK